MNVCVFGEFPSPLYKGFKKEEDARLFLKQGSFIMRRLCYYHKIEDSKRKDRGEGEGRVVIHRNRPVLQIDINSGKTLSETNEFGPVEFGVASINPRYIYCLSGPKVDVKYLADQYGGYVVCLNQPNKLVNDVTSYLESNISGQMWLECVQVRYDKGQTISKLPEVGSHERVSMSYGQKDPKFERDCEYRLVLTLPFIGNSPPLEIRVELHKRLKYAEMV